MLRKHKGYDPRKIKELMSDALGHDGHLYRAKYYVRCETRLIYRELSKPLLPGECLVDCYICLGHHQIALSSVGAAVEWIRRHGTVVAVLGHGGVSIRIGTFMVRYGRGRGRGRERFARVRIEVLASADGSSRKIKFL